MRSASQEGWYRGLWIRFGLLQIKRQSFVQLYGQTQNSKKRKRQLHVLSKCLSISFISVLVELVIFAPIISLHYPIFPDLTFPLLSHSHWIFTLHPSQNTVDIDSAVRMYIGDAYNWHGCMNDQKLVWRWGGFWWRLDMTCGSGVIGLWGEDDWRRLQGGVTSPLLFSTFSMISTFFSGHWWLTT